MFDNKGKIADKRWLFMRLGSHGQSKAVLRFIAPAEVKGVALLIVNHPDRASDQWMWTPAIQRERRIALQDRSTRFFGTDFSFEDLEERDVNQYNYRLLGEEAVDGAPCWRIESTPSQKKISQYTKPDVLDPEGQLRVRADRELRQGRPGSPFEVQRFRASARHLDCAAAGDDRSPAQEPHAADAGETRIQHPAQRRRLHAAGAAKSAVRALLLSAGIRRVRRAHRSLRIGIRRSRVDGISCRRTPQNDEHVVRRGAVSDRACV